MELYSKDTITGLRDQQGKVYFIGAGIGSLAGATYCIKDGQIPGRDISILEQSGLSGGSLDASGNYETGYSLRGSRMFSDIAYTCTLDFLEMIPSLKVPGKTLRDEFHEFNSYFHTYSKARLVDGDAHIVNSEDLGISITDGLRLSALMTLPEWALKNKAIDGYFSEDFFTSNFWYMWATTFAFQPWHSLVEFKRYALRFIDEFPRLHTLAGVRRTALNQYDSIIVPVSSWLKDQGVQFVMNARVTNLSFTRTKTAKKRVSSIHYCDAVSGAEKVIPVGEYDLVIPTIGSMTDASDLGSMTKAPNLRSKAEGAGWTLWENIAKDNPEFGRPTVFDGRIAESKWESFTVTLKDKKFAERLAAFTGNRDGNGGLITFKDSHWLMSIVLYWHPYLDNQPADVDVVWGYGLFPDRLGNYVNKKMADCTGAEILTELLGHLRFDADKELILKTSVCIPCMMPFITSQFLTRSASDRPVVVPSTAENFAFIGQFSEIPDDIVFTVDYSVRGAQTAVYKLLKINKELSPIHRGHRDPRVLYRAAKSLLGIKSKPGRAGIIQQGVGQALNSSLGSQ